MKAHILQRISYVNLLPQEVEKAREFDYRIKWKLRGIQRGSNNKIYGHHCPHTATSWKFKTFKTDFFLTSTRMNIPLTYEPK